MGNWAAGARALLIAVGLRWVEELWDGEGNYGGWGGAGELCSWD